MFTIQIIKVQRIIKTTNKILTKSNLSQEGLKKVPWDPSGIFKKFEKLELEYRFMIVELYKLYRFPTFL